MVELWVRLSGRRTLSTTGRQEHHDAIDKYLVNGPQHTRHEKFSKFVNEQNSRRTSAS